MNSLDEWVADHAENCDCHLDETCDCGQAERVKELAQLREDNKYLNSEIDRLDNLIEPLLHSDEEFAQLRLALAERDKTIEEARKLLLYVQEKISPLNPFKEQVDGWLSAHPAQESEEL